MQESDKQALVGGASYLPRYNSSGARTGGYYSFNQDDPQSALLARAARKKKKQQQQHQPPAIAATPPPHPASPGCRRGIGDDDGVGVGG